LLEIVMKHRWTALLVLLVPSIGLPAYTDRFSSQFRAAIDAAMEQQSLSGRRDMLLQAMHQAKDEEVFFIIPLLFQPPTFDKAKEAGVCVKEINDSLNDVQAYLATPAQEQSTFPAAKSAQIRAHMDALIPCICQYYKDGVLAFPPQQPNKSFKPNPLRGSA
jgi:hypothetical protein